MYAAAVLNTITNLGSSWPGTLALALVDPATLRACELGGAGEDEGLTDAQTHAGVVEGLGRCVHGLGLVPAVAGRWDLTAGGRAGCSCHSNESDTTPAFQAQACAEAGGRCGAQQPTLTPQD